MAFCLKLDVKETNPTIATVCMFVEFLARTFSSDKSIRNYLSAIRYFHKCLQIDAPSLYSFELNLMLRAYRTTLRGTPHRLPITKDILYELCSRCEQFGSTGLVIKCAFLFAFFGFLRCSNLVPNSARSFDKTRHLCRGDVFVHPPGLIIVLKWTKTKQEPGNIELLPISEIPGSPLCPVAAFTAMCARHPARQNGPMFIVRSKKAQITITARILRDYLSQLLRALGLSTISYTVHSFRKGGATMCYNMGCQLADIKNHGQWKSDAVFKYIFPNLATKSKLPVRMASQFT